MDFRALLDKIIIHFTGPNYSDDVQSAKKEFFGNTLPIDEDMQQFHLRMLQFLDWYAFDYQLKDTGLTPIETLIENKNILPLDNNDHLEKLKHPHHSLFEYVKINRKGFVVKDLITQKKIQIHDSITVLSFDRDEYFEARLISVEKLCYISYGICFHPIETKPFILEAIEKVRLLGQYEHKELMRTLAKMRFKFDKFPHIQTRYIYSHNPLFLQGN